MVCKNPNNCCGGSNCTPTLNSTENFNNSMKLPRRSQNVVDNANVNPVWSIDNGSNDINNKCDKHSNVRDGVCCKDLKGEDERTLINPDVVRDAIIGLSDGLSVPFGMTAGLAGLGDSRLVVLGGLAELIAGSISMGVGGFLASEAERNHFRYMRRVTRQRVARSCQGEMEREVFSVLGSVGIDLELSSKIANNLQSIEPPLPSSNESSSSFLRSIANFISRNPKTTSKDNHDHEEQVLRWSDDVGLSAFLLKYGEGMEDIETSKLYISALTVGFGYFIGGLVPLLPYFFIKIAQHALIISIIVTGITLLIFGAAKQHFTGGTGGVGGYLYGSISMLFVGGLAAGSSYGLVKLLGAN